MPLLLLRLFARLSPAFLQSGALRTGAPRAAAALVLLPLAASALGLSGCTPSIGDKCNLSTDCSIRGDRLCDTAQPNGYCTVFNCGGNSCPDNAACVLFNASVQGCAYDDTTFSRTARSFCMKHCDHDSDCRQDDGYKCRNPTKAPWQAVYLDDVHPSGVCMIPDPFGGNETPIQRDSEAPVCKPGVPEDAASFPPSDAGTHDATLSDSGSDARPSDASGDAPSDASDAGSDAHDAESDAGVDASDAATD